MSAASRPAPFPRLKPARGERWDIFRLFFCRVVDFYSTRSLKAHQCHGVGSYVASGVLSRVVGSVCGNEVHTLSLVVHCLVAGE